MLGVVGLLSSSGNSQNQKIPKKFEKIDQNKNNSIEIHEVNNAIDYFFIGLKGYDLQYIHELIDYFYSQE